MAHFDESDTRHDTWIILWMWFAFDEHSVFMFDLSTNGALSIKDFFTHEVIDELVA
jgi:hypothetical protein